MPTVPTVQGRQVSSNPLPSNGSNLQYSPDNFGAGLAQVGEQYAGAFAQLKGKADLAQAQDALLQFQGHAEDQFSNLQNMQGKNAIGQGGATVTNIRSKAEELAASLPDGASRQMFMQQANQLGLQYKRQAITYERGQIREFEDSRQQGLLSGWQTQIANDPQAFTSLAPLARQSISMYGASRGQSDEEIDANWLKWKQDSAWSAGQNAMANNYLQTRQLVGEPSDIDGGMRVPTALGHGDSRGIRNNNPGNIRASSNKWDGQTGDDGEYVTFSSPEHGIRALGKNLLSYDRQGYDTVEEIIGRWAPDSENDTSAYINAVSSRLGVSPSEPIDLTDANTLAAMSKAIIQHENGNTAYTDEQVRSGVNAALGLSALPESGRKTGVSWFDALTPYQQATLQKQIDEQGKKQRDVYREQLESDKKGWYAALDQGLMPDSMAGKQHFINAYGAAKGEREWRDFQEQQAYGSIISAASDMSPTARADLLEKSKPTDPNEPNFEAAQQRWEKMRIKFGEFDKAYESAQGVARVDASLQNNFPLDPNDKNNQAAIDAKYDREIAPNFNINSSDSLRSVAEITTKTGMIPTKVKTMLTSGARTKDPAVAIPMARMYGQIFDNNPAAAAANIDKGDMAFYQKVYSYDRAGVPAERAVDIAYNTVYQQDDQLKQMISKQLRDKEYTNARDNAAQKNINALSPSWTSFGSPGIKDAGKSNMLYRRDYQTIYDANFAQSGGDVQQAEAITNAMVRNTWGVTTVNGKEEVMKYAPEAMYGVNNGAGNWVAGQWAEEKKELKSKAFGGARDDSDLVLVADALTPRDRSYGVMVRQKNAGGYDDVRPYLGEKGMPIRFVPDQKTSPMYKSAIESQKKSVVRAKAERAERDAIGLALQPQDSNNAEKNRAEPGEGNSPQNAFSEPYGYGENSLPSPFQPRSN